MIGQKYGQNPSMKRPKTQYRVFWFICRWWLTYGVFAGIAFVAGITPFIPFCADCRSNFEVIRSPIDLIFILLTIVGGGGLVGALAGLFLGIPQAAFIRFWIYYPTNDIQTFRRKVIWSNLALPTALMIFSCIILAPAIQYIVDYFSTFYLPILAYVLAVIVGLLVSRKFLRWWI